MAQQVKKPLRTTVADYEQELAEIWELLHDRDVKEDGFASIASWRSWESK
jgi:hypothetical protein